MGLKGQAGVYEGKKKLLLVYTDTILGIPEHQRIWLDSKCFENVPSVGKTSAVCFIFHKTKLQKFLHRVTGDIMKLRFNLLESLKLWYTVKTWLFQVNDLLQAGGDAFERKIICRFNNLKYFLM